MPLYWNALQINCGYIWRQKHFSYLSALTLHEFDSLHSILSIAWKCFHEKGRSDFIINLDKYGFVFGWDNLGKLEVALSRSRQTCTDIVKEMCSSWGEIPKRKWILNRGRNFALYFFSLPNKACSGSIFYRPSCCLGFRFVFISEFPDQPSFFISFSILPQIYVWLRRERVDEWWLGLMQYPRALCIAWLFSRRTLDESGT